MENRFGRGRSAVAAVVLLAVAGVVQVVPLRPASAAGGTISGVAFKDLNRDGVKQPDEEPLAGKPIYLFDAAGNYLRNAPTDSAGVYQMTDVAPGTYRVEYGLAEWWELWKDWAPSTTGSIRPKVTVQLTGAAIVDFGWRPIVRTVQPQPPVSTFIAPSGLTIHSYNDVVSATDLYAALMEGSLQGNEQATTIIDFDTGAGDACVSRTTQVDGRYGDYSAGCTVHYLRWLEFGDKYFFHEYGHAWSLYYAYIAQQDPSVRGYLSARGIDPTDPRLGTSHAWSSYEMLAEDYRTLFGSPNARAYAQENSEIPAAGDVAGLREYLSTTFITPPTGPTPPPPPASTSMHIGDLDGSAALTSRAWTATVAASVDDGGGQPVTGATVTISMGTGRQAKAYTCITGASGRCSVAVTVSTKTKAATFSVSSITKSAMTYAATANRDPDGDSDGTTIMVQKPA